MNDEDYNFRGPEWNRVVRMGIINHGRSLYVDGLIYPMQHVQVTPDRWENGVYHLWVSPV